MRVIRWAARSTLSLLKIIKIDFLVKNDQQTYIEVRVQYHLGSSPINSPRLLAHGMTSYYRLILI